jgi:hypothetical protein
MTPDQPMTYEEAEEQQRGVCRARDQQYVPANPESKVGFALQTLGLLPINGLRHLPQGDTNGWYLWCGERMSSDPDFFAPLHTRHLIERCPAVLKFLGLPPGYRFLVAGDYVDLWFDASLLDV